MSLSYIISGLGADHQSVGLPSPYHIIPYHYLGAVPLRQIEESIYIYIYILVKHITKLHICIELGHLVRKPNICIQ